MSERPTYNPEIQEMRDQAAKEVKEVRRRRDENRSESQTISNRIKSVFGTPHVESIKADRLGEQAKRDLIRHKTRINSREQSIKREEQDRVNREIRTGLKSFRTLYYSSRDLDQVQAEFSNQEAIFRRGLQNPETSSETLQTLSGYFDSPQFESHESEEFNVRIVNLLEENQSLIEGKLGGDLNENLVALRSAEVLLDHGQINHQKVGKELLLKSKDVILSNIFEGGINAAGISRYYEYVGLLYAQSDVKEREDIELKIKQALENDEVPAYARGGLAYTLMQSVPRQPEIGARMGRVFAEVISKSGVDGEKAIYAWIQSASNKDYNTIQINFQNLLEMEETKPGAAAYLAKEYGVFNFSRYPKELLFKQYENREDRTKPYGIVIYPRADHNAAFYQDKYVFKSIADQLGDNYNLRFSEAESKTEVVKRLIKFSNNYGPATFAVIGGHGERDGIEFGLFSKTGNKLTVDDLSGTGARKAKKFFVEHPTIILASCSTGMEGGMAQQLSERLGASVIGPNQPTSIKKVVITLVGDHLKFDLSYKDNSEKYYSKGIQEK